jgi:hypothetical protein
MINTAWNKTLKLLSPTAEKFKDIYVLNLDGGITNSVGNRPLWNEPRILPREQTPDVA